MIIKEIYIENFGKLKNFNINLKKGLNIIYGKNESGKTTLLNFILLTLYGDNSRSKDILINKRKKYTPWDNSQMKGYLIISKEEIDYKIERTFNASNTTDIVDVFKLSTGEKINISDQKTPGEFFFNMSYETFKKTLFISSEETVIDNDSNSDEIIKKLVNTVTTGDEDISYNKVIENIDNKLVKYSSLSSKKGILVDINNNIEKIKLDIEEAKKDEIDKINQIENIKEIEKENLELESKIKNTRKIIELNNQKNDILNNIKDTNYKINNIRSNIENSNIQIENKEYGLKEDTNQINIYLLGLALISGVLGRFVSKYIYILTGILLVLSIIESIKIKNKNEFNNSNINREIEKIKYNIEKDNKEINELEYELNILNKAYDEIDYELNNIKSDINVDNSDLDLLLEKYNNNLKEIEIIKATSKERYRGKKNLSTLIEDLEIENKNLLEKEKEYSLLLKTKDYIKKAYNELENSFSKVLNEKTSDIFSEITSNKYSDIYISSDLEISVKDEETKGIKNWRYMSNGTIDQLYFSLRLALIYLLVENIDDRILILDDLFIRFDDLRLLETLSFIKKEKENISQIIFVSSKDISNNIDFEYNKLVI